MKNWLKTFLKRYFLILKVRDRWSPSLQVAQRDIQQKYAAKDTDLRINQTGFRVFSQYEEDGKLLFCLSQIGMTNKTFIEIGADDGINSNSANLYFNFGFHGLFIDGNISAIKRGKRFFSKYPHPWFYPPKFSHAMVKRENINDIISEAGFKGEIGLLSIDIDGNDYWIWDALEVVKPQVVIIETHNEFGMSDLVVPYDSNYVYPGKHPIYHGASPVAMQKLGRKKGYRLVGANEMGYNFIFVKEELATPQLPEVSVESLLEHPSNNEAQKRFEEIKDWEFIKG